MKKRSVKSLSLNKVKFARLNNLEQIKGGRNAETDGIDKSYYILDCILTIDDTETIGGTTDVQL